MQLENLKKRFFTIVSPSLPNEWEVEDVLSHLLDLSEENVESLFEQVAVIWPVSHSLCFAYLLDGVNCIDFIPKELIAEWSRKILGLYETGGLLAARRFMAEPEKLFLGPINGLCGVSFSQVSERMQLYLNGVSGRRIELGVAQVPKTDTNKILVPDFIEIFPAQSDNTLLYKFLVSLQWAHVESRVFQDYLVQKECLTGNVTSFASFFPTSQKAKELFYVLQFVKAYWRLEAILPGLTRSVRSLCLDLVKGLSGQDGAFDYCHLLQSILRYSVERSDAVDVAYLDLADDLESSLERLRDENTFQVLPEVYDRFCGLEGECDFGNFALVLGSFDFDAAAAVIHMRREEEKNMFVVLLADALGQKKEDENFTSSSVIQELEGTSVVLTHDEFIDEKDAVHEEFLIGNGITELSEELKSLIKSIEDDIGELPEAYVQAAAGMAGKGVNNREPLQMGDSRGNDPSGPIGHSYDEWDYRRGGYRSSWCTLYEKSVSPVTSTFIDDTLRKYKGQLHKIRRQFEMLRNQNRFVRRRRYGDDIDFDALVDALGDAKAGIVPSDRLFLRLLRNKREISTYFLVDMSNSTEGWVGTAVKESLILMAEAMDIVGDPYAIYGFSGMRRSKSEVFVVKELQEPYNNLIKERITGIAPKEYTRMGPPIRHMTKKMLESDSRVRLLIIFSDGKPEDYDDYKGKYAIEDTRKALLEVRGAGIHVFCVTIDKTAHEYLGHMFGRGQFVFVDNVDSLPGKLVELYRLLTQQ